MSIVFPFVYYMLIKPRHISVLQDHHQGMYHIKVKIYGSYVYQCFKLSTSSHPSLLIFPFFFSSFSYACSFSFVFFFFVRICNLILIFKVYSRWALCQWSVGEEKSFTCNRGLEMHTVAIIPSGN